MSSELKNGKVRVNVYLPKKLVERMDEDAKLMGVSRGGIVNQRLTQFYLDLDTQIQVNKGIQMMTGMTSDEFMKQIMANIAKSMEK